MLRSLAKNPVYEKATRPTLGTFALRLEDVVADGEVLDLFEAALGTLYDGENLVGSEVGYRVAPPHSENREGNEPER